MSPYYDQPALRQRGPEDVAGVLVLLACAVLAFAWYVAVSRLHLSNQQCLEIFLYGAILFFGGGLLVAQLVGRRRRREENWPHPAIVVPASKDAATVRAANQGEATLLGYNVHKEPWIWPDVVRMKHGVIVGGTGSGKSTFLENIIAQDVMRRFGSRKMPMIIFDGKGEREFLHRLLPHIEAAGRLQDLRVIDPTHPAESARYNPFYALDDAYQEHVNFIFRSFGLREDFFKGHQEAYLSDLVRILQYTGKLFNVYDVLVMALDEKVLEEQIGVAKARLPAAVITEEGCTEEDRIIRQEARYRLKQGSGIRVFSRPEQLKKWLEGEGLSVADRQALITDAGQLVPGWWAEVQGVEFFVHSPFASRTDDGSYVERNDGCLVLHATFSADGTKTKVFFGADIRQLPLSEIIRITRSKNREERLESDVVKVPHHSSYLSLGPEKGKDKTVPTEEIAYFYEKKLQRRAILVSTSRLIPADENDNQPPHRQAADYYEEQATAQAGEYVITMKHPRASSPETLVVEISSNKAKLKRAYSGGIAAAVSSPARRAGCND